MSVTGSAVALDTNFAIAILSGESGAVGAIASFESICIPVPVLGELRYGALNSAQSIANLKAIENLAGRGTVLAADSRTAEVYAEVRIALKKSGRPIPENDVWIAALCIQHNVAIATGDSHFDQVTGLRRVPLIG